MYKIENSTDYPTEFRFYEMDMVFPQFPVYIRFHLNTTSFGPNSITWEEKYHLRQKAVDDGINFFAVSNDGGWFLFFLSKHDAIEFKLKHL